MAKILLIDDMQAVRAAIASVLRKSGHEVEEAPDGQEALARCKSTAFDIVITDIMMPNVDGVDVITSLKAATNCPPVIAMSGGGAGVPAAQALELAGKLADAQLNKPFENEQLLKTVQQFV
ncbi:MAG: response regulator [Pseudomonadota bacterium]